MKQKNLPNLGDTKHPWCVEIHMDLMTLMSITITKLERTDRTYEYEDGNFIDRMFCRPSVRYCIETVRNDELDERFIDLSKSIWVSDGNDSGEVRIIASTLDECVDEMRKQIVKIKEYFKVCLNDVKEVLHKMQLNGYISKEEWKGKDPTVRGFIEFFGEFKKRGGNMKYLCFSPKTMKEYFEFGFNEWLNAIDKNSNSCIEQALSVEEKLKSGELTDEYGEVECDSSICTCCDEDEVVSYRGNGARPGNYVPQTCD